MAAEEAKHLEEESRYIAAEKHKAAAKHCLEEEPKAAEARCQAEEEKSEANCQS